MNDRNEVRLRELADRGAAELAGAGAADLLRWTDETFGGATEVDGQSSCDYVVASNMQDAVLIDHAVKVRPGVPVIFLDTGYHFAETIGSRDAIDARYDIGLLNITPAHTVAEQDELMGSDLFARDPNECCRLRKVVPLARALRGFSAWVSGLRRVEAPSRANAPLISFDEVFHLVKVNPLAAWTEQDVQNYIAENNVWVNPLVDEGYLSIGCEPCTARPAVGADPRSGRWQGRSKTECGLHLS
ncbi:MULTISPECIES: phosphoadenylyl-sulfate reductase [unclassified Mycobacterium]|uniref:phosphoadenylyl-sulfate reductase n=1 Tax=unclassified Mycobacterium TaxID=2642494 RepID=UPI00274211BC|nr:MULTISPECIES: phosphoadenylyl-sulfate reductase [unclassified Mycobacterium]MDP7703523.1 phosphoadenylyl-sulfate reductase [Mycobacterium sp. TY815]MDP7722006.1 phosphoadenylyl-sulfate reductase [Mycobacterium sp. TY814]